MELMAHRGASGLAPENTLAAFRRGLEYEPEWFELDVHATADGAIVVMHDSTVDRTTNGTGAIGELTLAEIKALDAGSWRGAEFAGEPVPLLSEVVDLVGGKARLNVEIKAGPDLAVTAAKVVDILRAGGVIAWSIISSFDLSAVKAAQALDSGANLALITGNPADLDLVIEHELGWFNLHHEGLSPELIARAQAAHIRVNAWTINDLTRWNEFREMGVSVLTTDMCHLAPPSGQR